MISRLLKPTGLRTAEEGGELRHATWMELFYDLVFVVAMDALRSRLHNDDSSAGILQLVALFVPVWYGRGSDTRSTPPASTPTISSPG
jgi:low temperature requirement protein LtrA